MCVPGFWNPVASHVSSADNSPTGLILSPEFSIKATNKKWKLSVCPKGEVTWDWATAPMCLQAGPSACCTCPSRHFRQSSTTSVLILSSLRKRVAQFDDLTVTLNYSDSNNRLKTHLCWRKKHQFNLLSSHLEFSSETYILISSTRRDDRVQVTNLFPYSLSMISGLHSCMHATMVLTIHGIDHGNDHTNPPISRHLIISPRRLIRVNFTLTIRETIKLVQERDFSRFVYSHSPILSCCVGETFWMILKE